jgi:hypothetical protein
MNKYPSPPREVCQREINPVPLVFGFAMLLWWLIIYVTYLVLR